MLLHASSAPTPSAPIEPAPVEQLSAAARANAVKLGEQALRDKQVGVILVAVGILLTFAGRLPFRIGRLPGDIYVQGKNSSFYFPLATCLVLSLLLSVVFYYLGR